MRKLVLCALSMSCIAALHGAAHATDIMFNDGVSHVITDGTYSSDEVYVRNMGCPTGWPNADPWDDCLSPGDPTNLTLVDGGYVGFDLEAYDSSTITMTGGEVGFDLEARVSSTISISGGLVMDDLEAYNSSTITMTGGEVGGALEAENNSIITIVGSGFKVDGFPVPHGNLTALNGTLTGMLVSGDTLNADFCQGGGRCRGTITLVPEPSTALLIGGSLVALLGLARRRRLS